MRALPLALALAAGPLAASEAPQPALAEGEVIRDALHADFNADGVPDIAYIVDTADDSA